MLFRSAWKLSRNAQASSAHVGDINGLFGYIARAGAELSSTAKPTDLKSLVRVLSAVGTFKYPAFKPAIRKLVRNPDQSDWHTRLVDEASSCSQSKALEYLKVLGQAEGVPQDLVETLIKKVKITSPKELRDYISAVKSIPSERLTSEVRNSTTFVVKNAIINKMRLSTYLHIWHMIHHHWRTGHKHIIPTKLRSDLIQATWNAVPSLDLTKESDFVDCVTWLAMAEQPSLLPNKDEIASVLDKLEMQARRSVTKSISPSSVITLLSHIIGETRGDSLREPLDAIAQTLLKQFMNIRKPQHQENLTFHIELASAIERAMSRASIAAVEQIIESVLPLTVEVLERNLSQIPSRSLPVVLRLVSRVGGSVDEEIAHRGHEMDGKELVRLVNSISVPRELILSLFKTCLNDVDLLTDLVSSLTLSEKLEFLATLIRSGVYHHDDLTILTEGLIEGIKSDSAAVSQMNHENFSLDTLIKLCACGDSDLVDSMTNGAICPDHLLGEFLASDRPVKELGINQAIDLLAINNCPARNELCDFAFASKDSLSVSQCVRLLSVLDKAEPTFNEAVKLVVPKISTIEDINELMVHVSMVPSADSSNKYAPSNQLRLALEDRIAQLVDRMDPTQLSACISNMSRLGLYSPNSASKLVGRLGEIGAVGAQEANRMVMNLVNLGVFDKKIMDGLVGEFVRNNNRATDGTSVAQLATACTKIGYKNKELTDMCEEVLRRGQVGEISETISLLNSLAKNQVYSPLFQEKLRQVMDECGKDIAAVSESDWIRLYEINLALLVDSPPRIKSKYMNDKTFKSFIDDNCSYSWYAQQERKRTGFIHSAIRGELQSAIESLGWSMRVPEIGKEVYHVDFMSSGGESDNRVVIVVIPESDELRRSTTSSVKIVIGDSMTKIRHLQMFGYTVVPVWESEWKCVQSPDKQKELLLKYSNQVVYATGVSPK